MNILERSVAYFDKWLVLFNKVKSFFTNKWVKRWFVFVGVLFIAFSNVTTYAQEAQEVTIDGTEVYSTMSWLKCLFGYQGDVCDEKDNFATNDTFIKSVGLIALGTVWPGSGSTYANALEDERFDNVATATKLGLLGTVDQMNSQLITKPPTVDLVAHLSDEWVPGEDLSTNSVYAQDGYDMLTAVNINDLWETTRGIAYALFVIALIIAGFMIMFRQKIGGQLSVTVFNTIPKVIVGLILVTFSFAIVGLIIDVGAMMINVIASLLNLSDPLVVASPFSLLGALLRGDTGLGTDFGVLLGGGLATALLGGILTAVSGPVGAVIGGVGLLGVIVALVIAGLVFYASIKVFITLLKAWVGIIVDTILGPLFLVFSVIPGKSNIGWNWFYRIIRNVLTFVGVFLIVNLAIYLNEANVQFYFPEGLAGGDTSPSSSPVILFLMNAVLPLFLFFTAAEVPNFLEDIIPKDGGKGTATAFGNVQKSFSKVPVVGSAFA